MRRRRRVLLAGLAVFCAAQAVYWTEPRFAFDIAERLVPDVVWRVKTDQPLVGLSFDDGPDPAHMPRVLAILAQHRARATFFLIGERARAHPDLVARIKAEGHDVGNHYAMNGATLGHSDSDFVRYLEHTEQAIGVQPPPKLFRAPGGIAWPHQLRLARSKGYTCVALTAPRRLTRIAAAVATYRRDARAVPNLGF